MHVIIVSAILAGSCNAASGAGGQDVSPLPVITVDRDNVTIDRSCILDIDQSPIIDADGDGVVHIVGDDITVAMRDGQVLRGSAANTTPDAYTGVGVSVHGSNITLQGFAVSGFKVGVLAQRCNGLTIDGAMFHDNFRQRLTSTSKAEDARDWLWPHANDDKQWRTNYGAALCIEDSSGVTVRRVHVRKGQNGILLDRVRDSLVYDCDCSFLSGWGLAMWRSSGNMVSRNAFDFCVRGYSHGVYNRGQDSAGILMFEQCSNNVIIENSVTHGGDGVFGFAGKEALGETNPRDDDAWYAEQGGNRNAFVGNDFSYAAAHGLEMTFSFHNHIVNNRFTGNAICGIWGGYSQSTTIAENTFEANGDMAYGLERGGVNIEHGRGNVIANNTFTRNACGVHLWWDDDVGIAATPWARANGVLSANNQVLHNQLSENDVNIQLRQTSATQIVPMREDAAPPDLDADEFSHSTAILIPHARDDDGPPRPDHAQRDAWQPRGETRPVGQRAHLAGREHIIMTEWGPYEHDAPMLVREPDADAATQVYRLLGAQPLRDLRHVLTDGNVEPTIRDSRIHVRAAETGAIVPYTLDVVTLEGEVSATGAIITAEWRVQWFAFPVDESKQVQPTGQEIGERPLVDPREQRETWLAHGNKAETQATIRGRLHLPYGSGGWNALRNISRNETGLDSADRFGTIATTRLKLPAGRWRFTTTSDDGVRVLVDGEPIIDNWTWHPPTVDSADIEFAQERTLDIRVEHFELEGYAILSLDIEPVSPAGSE